MSLRCSVRSGSALPFLAMPGIRLTPGSTGSAALSIVGSALGWPSMVRSVMRSSTQHHLAADADHVAVDRGGAGGEVPGDRLGHVDRQTALAHRVHPLADLAGREGYGGGHLGDDEARRHG